MNTLFIMSIQLVELKPEWSINVYLQHWKASLVVISKLSRLKNTLSGL